MLGASGSESDYKRLAITNPKFGENPTSLASKIKQVKRELEEWAELGRKNKLNEKHFDRMLIEATELNRLITKAEL